MEAVAVTCCDLGIELFDARNAAEELTITRQEFIEIAQKITALQDRVDHCDANHEDDAPECPECGRTDTHAHAL